LSSDFDVWLIVKFGGRLTVSDKWFILSSIAWHSVTFRVGILSARSLKDVLVLWCVVCVLCDMNNLCVTYWPVFSSACHVNTTKLSVSVYKLLAAVVLCFPCTVPFFFSCLSCLSLFLLPLPFTFFLAAFMLFIALPSLPLPHPFPFLPGSLTCLYIVRFAAYCCQIHDVMFTLK